MNKRTNNSRHFLDNLWRWKCGQEELEAPEPVSLSDLYRSEWSEEFEQLMRNRMVMGYFRYGPMKGGVGKLHYDRVSSALRRLMNYQESGNQELLVDAANLLLLEFVEKNHPNAHFSSVDDGEHCVTK